MSRRTLIAAGAGAGAGAVFGLLAVALVSARVLDGGLASGDAFVVQQSALYLYTVVAGAVGGSVIAMIGYGVGTQASPDEHRYGMGPLAVVGAGAGAAFAFAALRATMGLAADIVDKMAVLPLSRAGEVALVTGAVTGLLVAVTVERLSRPIALGLEGVAWPRTFGRFARDAAAAMGWPAVALGGGAVLVYGLSRVLLEAETTVALFIFGGISAVFLFGAALIAARPPRR